MMLADLPPSSWCTRLTVSAAALATSDAGAGRAGERHHVDVRDGATIASPTVGPSPLTRLNTPFGTPASCMTSAKMMALSGAISDGFSTMVQPAASAGRDLADDLVDRPVPRRDHAADADRLLGDQGRAAQLLELEVLRASAIILSRWPMPVAACALCASHDRRAHLPRDRVGDVVVALLVGLEDAPQQREALLLAWCAIGGEGGLRAADRASTSAAEPRLICAPDSSVAGLMTSSASARRVDPGAVDVELGILSSWTVSLCVEPERSGDQQA